MYGSFQSSSTEMSIGTNVLVDVQTRTPSPHYRTVHLMDSKHDRVQHIAKPVHGRSGQDDNNLSPET